MKSETAHLISHFGGIWHISDQKPLQRLVLSGKDIRRLIIAQGILQNVEII